MIGGFNIRAKPLHLTFYIKAGKMKWFNIRKMQWQDDRDYTGSSRSPQLTGPPVYRRESLGSEVNVRSGPPPGMSTGRLWSLSQRKDRSPVLEKYLANDVMPNSPGVNVLPSMSGKKIPGLPAHSLSSVSDQSDETNEPIGIKYGNLPNGEITNRFRRIYEFVVMVRCEKSAMTTMHQLQWSAAAMSIGATLELESRGLLGMKPEWTVILKIPIPNSGVLTEVSGMLSSTNFVVASMSHTYSGGWIVIRSAWRLKGQVSHYVQNAFGSLPTYALMTGTQT